MNKLIISLCLSLFITSQSFAENMNSANTLKDSIGPRPTTEMECNKLNEKLSPERQVSWTTTYDSKGEKWCVCKADMGWNDSVGCVITSDKNIKGDGTFKSPTAK